MRRGRLVDGGNAHKPLNRQPMLGAAARNEVAGLSWRHPGFLRLLTSVDLHVETRRAPRPGHGLGQRAGELVAIDGLDHIEQGHRILGFIGLKRTDQAKLQVVMGGAAFRPARLGFLDPVLAENTLSRGEHGLDALIGLLLGDRHQGDGVCSAAGLLGGGGETLQYFRARSGKGVKRVGYGHGGTEV